MIKLKLFTSYFKVASYALLALVLAFSISLLLPIEHAAATGGNAYFTLTPSSGSYTVGGTISIQVAEYDTNSSDAVNSIEANLLYPSSLLQFDSSTINGPFNSIVVTNSGGSGAVNIATASYSAAGDNTSNNVSDLTFTVLASGSTSTSSSSPAYFGMTAGNPSTGIDATSGASVWNGVLPGAAFTLNAASSGGGGGTSGGGTSGSTSGSSGSTSSSSSKSSSSSSKSAGSSSAPATPAPSTASTPVTLSTTPAATSPATTTTTLCSLSVTVTGTLDKPVVGATVTLNTGQSAKTNSYGVVTFSGIPSGTYSVKIKDPGKKPTSSSVAVGSGQNKMITYKLASNQVVTGNETALTLLIVILLAIGFIIFRRVRSGFHPTLSGNNGNNVIVGGSPSPISTPPSPIDATNAAQPVSPPAAATPPPTTAEPVVGNIDPDATESKVIAPEGQSQTPPAPSADDQSSSLNDPKPL